MVQGFIIKSKDYFTIKQIKISLKNFPKEMKYTIFNIYPLKVNIVPDTDKLKLAMYKDKLKGKRAESIKKQYINILLPFFRIYVKNINKMEVLPYD